MQKRLSIALSVLLTWIAGYVDAVGFLSLAQIYTANMSGNSVAIGIRAASQDWRELARRLCPVVAYVVGLLLCRLLIEFGARKRIRRVASIAFAMEGALLMAVLLAHETNSPMSGLRLIALLSLAMGIQNGALTRFSSLTIHTGFVTGALVKFAEETTKYLTWAFDCLRAPQGSLREVLAQSGSQKPLRIAVWLAFIWIAYVVGAIAGALEEHRLGLRALIAPLAALALCLAVDRRWPLALEEEQTQAKTSS